jgi:hypothetical protein
LLAVAARSKSARGLGSKPPACTVRNACLTFWQRLNTIFVPSLTKSILSHAFTAACGVSGQLRQDGILIAPVYVSQASEGAAPPPVA